MSATVTKLGIFQGFNSEIIKETILKDPIYFKPKSDPEPLSPEVVEANNNFKNYLHEHFS